MSYSPFTKVLENLKSFYNSVKNKNKCTPKYALKLIGDQLKYGQPIYMPKHSSQQFDSNKMEVFCFEVSFGVNLKENLKGENLPYGKYKTAQHLAALNLLQKVFDTSSGKHIGNEIIALLNSNQEVWYEIAPVNKNQIQLKDKIQESKSLRPLMSIKFDFD